MLGKEIQNRFENRDQRRAVLYASGLNTKTFQNYISELIKYYMSRYSKEVKDMGNLVYRLDGTRYTLETLLRRVVEAKDIPHVQTMCPELSLTTIFAAALLFVDFPDVVLDYLVFCEDIDAKLIEDQKIKYGSD